VCGIAATMTRPQAGNSEGDGVRRRSRLDECCSTVSPVCAPFLGIGGTRTVAADAPEKGADMWALFEF
jgi:hypothetical protein